MQLETHLWRFNASLSNDSPVTARTALSALHADAAAQVLTYVPTNSATCCMQTLQAVSPQMRVNAETLAWSPWAEDEVMRAQVDSQQVVFFVRSRASHGFPVKLAHTLWWADRCRLPLVLSVDNTHCSLLQLLSGEMRARVARLSVHLPPLPSLTCSPLQSSSFDASTADSMQKDCETFLCGLKTFSQLTELSVTNANFENNLAEAIEIKNALFVASDTGVHKITLVSCRRLSDFSTLRSAPHLRSLTVVNSGIRTLHDLTSCPSITSLKVSHCHLIENLASLAGAPCLSTLWVCWCSLASLDGLSSCPQLSEVDVSGNQSLRSLRGVCGAPCLTSLVARNCNLHDVDGLADCRQLTDVDVSYNSQLVSLAGVAGAPRLARLAAVACGLERLEALQRCPLLVELDVRCNTALRDVDKLAALPVLKR